MCGSYFLPEHFSEFEDQQEEYDSFISLYRAAHPSMREWYEQVWGREWLRERFKQVRKQPAAPADEEPTLQTKLRAAFEEGFVACHHLGAAMSVEQCWEDSATKAGQLFGEAQAVAS